MNRILMCAGAASLGLMASACMSTYPPPPPPPMGGAPAAMAAPPAPEFLRMASESDEFERQAGQMAASKGTDPRVRDFGSMMVRDHSMTSTKLMAAAQQGGVPQPPPPPLRPDHAAMLQQLSAMDGPDFDVMYIGGQVDAHREALALMQGYASGGDNDALRAAAGQAVPIIKGHLQHAKQIKRDYRGVPPRAH